MNLKGTKPHGLIIWTLRRTGGTNFTNWLTELLKDQLKILQHEPFNFDRIYGWISKNFKEGQIEKTEESIKEILSNHCLIKHCVETVPRDLNFILAAISKELNYINLFLYRKNSAERILSLHFAKQTNLWGYKQVINENTINKELDTLNKVLQRLLPLMDLFRQDEYDRKLLRDVYYKLKSKNAPVFEFTYEELYLDDLKNINEKIVEFLEIFNVEIDNKLINEFLMKLRMKGNQGTKKFYRNFPNIEEFYKAFNRFTPFVLDPFETDLSFLSSIGELSFPENEIKRLDTRKWILQYAKKEGVGAEVGVYRGHFAEILIKELNPKKLYLIDPWTKVGETWEGGENSPYTAFGKVTTKYAREDTKRRMLPYLDKCEIIIIEDFIENFSFPEKLDWIYLDTSHNYEDTKRQLRYLTQFLKPDGILMGDDWHPDSHHKHHGVFKAVNEFIKANPSWEIVAAGYGAQWCIRRRSNLDIIYPLNLIGEVASCEFIFDWHFDYIPRIVGDEPFKLDGVIVINKNYNQADFDLILIKNDEELIPVTWYINSHWYAQKHPDNPNAKKARFSSQEFSLKNGDTLVFAVKEKESGKSMEIIRIIRRDYNE